MEKIKKIGKKINMEKVSGYNLKKDIKKRKKKFFFLNRFYAQNVVIRGENYFFLKKIDFRKIICLTKTECTRSCSESC